MDDNVDVAASNEGDMTMDMDDDYTQDENEVQDDEETDEIMENNWREQVIQECEGAQHHVVSDEQEDLMRLAREEDLMRLAREEVEASMRGSYSTKE
ncbi:hypothetical protein AMTR_s00095p00139360 [Amborella trichopoda]|uniref:Uncharacterized protein n=1 Tax=Amborella trichopoda TaxID=13333 RepID=W1NP60_AMBTC|nr:hypothetical protein AMTR_s00095p00139360 [Amborella trichopoda]